MITTLASLVICQGDHAYASIDVCMPYDLSQTVHTCCTFHCLALPGLRFNIRKPTSTVVAEVGYTQPIAIC